MDFRLAITTCPNMDVADAIASTLVEERLVACVNILPGALSVYEWQGKVEKEQELVLLMKSHSGKLGDLQTRLLELHPYELPELIVVPLVGGLPSYLSWIETQLEKNK